MEAALAAALAAWEPSDPPADYNASVLMLVFPRREDGKLSILLTRRSKTLSSHPGEVAFPGAQSAIHCGSLKYAALTSCLYSLFVSSRPAHQLRAGGKRDETDTSSVDTALREAMEGRRITSLKE
jgi:hypothetical protein